MRSFVRDQNTNSPCHISFKTTERLPFLKGSRCQFLALHRQWRHFGAWYSRAGIFCSVLLAFFYCVIFCTYITSLCHVLLGSIYCVTFSLYMIITEHTHTRIITSGVIITYFYDWCRVGNSIQFSTFEANTLTDCANSYFRRNICRVSLFLF